MTTGETAHGASLPPQMPGAPAFTAEEFPRMDRPGVRKLFQILWRRRMVFIACLLLGLSLTAIGISLIKPQYTARSLILIENAGPRSFGEGLAALPPGALPVPAEAEIIRSRGMGRKIVENLNLMSDPELNPRFRHAESRAGRNAAPFKKFSVYGSELESLPAALIEKEIDGIVTGFLSRLDVTPLPESPAIEIRYTAADPVKAAFIANAAADLYLEQRLEDRFQAARKVGQWLEERLKALRGQIYEAEIAVARHKERHDIAESPPGFAMPAEQVAALTRELIRARAGHAEAKARLQKIREMAGDSGLIETIPEIADAPAIQDLKTRRAESRAALSALSARYGPKHIKIKQAQARLSSLQTQLREEILKSAASAENEVSFAHARIRALEENLGHYAGQRHEGDEAAIELRELTRQAESARMAYDALLASYRQSGEPEAFPSSEARIISYAAPPTSPSYPDRGLAFLVAAALSALAGLLLSLLVEKLDDAFRNAAQVERVLGQPCPALIPRVENAAPGEIAGYVISKPASVVAESVRTLRTAINLRPSRSGTAPKCITITSSFPQEGKTTLAVWMGRLAARSGEKAIVIDADLRRPSLHEAVGQPNESCLVDYLTGHKTLGEIVHKDGVSGLHVIFGRAVPNSALDLISSEKMRKLVESLRQAYDLVIIDSPACMAVSDPKILAKMSDRLVYAVAWDKTRREIAASGIRQFTSIGLGDIAVALTGVDVKRHTRYGYGDAVYYYGRYREYYAD